MLTLPELIIVALIIFAGATVFSTVGFGIGVSTIPLLFLFIDPQGVVVIINAVSIFLFILVIYQTRRQISFKDAIPLSIAGLLGVPVGVYFLGATNASILRISIAGLIIAVTLLSAFNVRKALPTSKPVLLGVGFLVSVLLTALGVGGALLALTLLSRNLPRHAIRGTLSFYFLIVEGVGVIGYGVTGLFTLERLIVVLVAIIPVALGFGLATLIVRRMNETVFRRSVVAVIIVSSLVVLGRELVNL